ncbi:MAG: helix-turn-helix domain-containing protein [Actinomycetota bacterium]|nr:helix-turn-helix domain-containing protein [Actinomycetota bacterium]
MLQLGENLARIRTARGLTQDELAGSSGVSVDTISRLERGAHATARRSTLAALSRALGTDPARLLGIRPPEQDTAGAEQLRRAVRALDLPDFAEPSEVLGLPELHDAASDAWSDYLAGRHTELLAGLPALMVDTRRAVHHLADDHAAEAAGLLAAAYRLAAGLSGRLGLVDLAAHAAHRALDTARFTTRPELDEAAALRYLAWVLVRQGDLAEAERIAVRAAERLDGGLLARPDADRIGVFGSLLFNAASAAARQGSPDRADDLLRAASAAAARSGADRVAETGVFGPRVAAMQAVDQSMRTGQPDRAVRLAAQVPDTAGTVPAFWEAGHRLHLAAACADLERWSDVAVHLDAARTLAPQWSRVQPLGRTVIGHLLEHRSRRSDRIILLAEHYGT